MTSIAETKPSMIPAAPAKLLEGKRGLIVGIANDRSIAWGCAKAFRALGSELAVTYINQKTRTYVEPLARELEAPILMPLDVRVPGQMEAVFERIAKDWGRLDFVIHSIAFAPKDALQGRPSTTPGSPRPPPLGARPARARPGSRCRRPRAPSGRRRSRRPARADPRSLSAASKPSSPGPRGDGS
jgi:hypothetical protein